MTAVEKKALTQTERLKSNCFFTITVPLQDDKTVLSNPHKGWYYHSIDNGLTRPTYRDGVTKEDLPEPDGSYLLDSITVSSL